MHEQDGKLATSLLKIGSVATGLLLWHVLAVFVINDTTLLVSPAVVVRTAYDMLFVTGELYPHLFASSWIFFYGFILAIVAGVPLGFVMALSPVVRDYVNPWMATLYTTPRIAFAPVLLLWFGIGVVSKMVMVAMAVSFTVFLSTLAGLDRVDRRAIDLMRSFGAGRLNILWRLRLPTALPLLLAGMRVSTVRSVIVAIITEMLGAYGGLGWVIYQAVLQIDFVQVWSAIFVASAASLSFFGLIGFLERKILFWK